MKKGWIMFLSVLSGVLIGGINGFLGAGGGMLLVPLLQYVLKIEDKKAHATAVFVILPISLISGIVYIIKGAVDWSIFLPVVIGSVVGGIVGTFLLKNMKSEVVNLLFWGVMIASGLWIVLSNLK